MRPEIEQLERRVCPGGPPGVFLLDAQTVGVRLPGGPAAAIIADVPDPAGESVAWLCVFVQGRRFSEDVLIPWEGLSLVLVRGGTGFDVLTVQTALQVEVLLPAGGHVFFGEGPFL